MHSFNPRRIGLLIEASRNTLLSILEDLLNEPSIVITRINFRGHYLTFIAEIKDEEYWRILWRITRNKAVKKIELVENPRVLELIDKEWLYPISDNERIYTYIPQSIMCSEVTFKDDDKAVNLFIKEVSRNIGRLSLNELIFLVGALGLGSIVEKHSPNRVELTVSCRDGVSTEYCSFLGKFFSRAAGITVDSRLDRGRCILAFKA